MTVVGIYCSIKSSSRSPYASQSRTTWSIWQVGFLIVAGLLINPLIMSSSSWFLILRASSYIRGARKSFSGYRGGGNCGYTKVGLGLAGGYKMRFFVIPPLAIVILPVRHPMYASAVASHGLPSINGCPSSPLLGLMMRKSANIPKSRRRWLYHVMCQLVELPIDLPTATLLRWVRRSQNPGYCRFP
jgi:hypothetical protein